MSIKTIANCYGVEVSGDVRPTLDDDERRYYVRAVEEDMARCLAHHILDQKRGAVRVHNPNPVTEKRTLELYVMTPAEFHLEVRKEAKKYLELTQRYPLYPSSKPYAGGF